MLTASLVLLGLVLFLVFHNAFSDHYLSLTRLPRLLALVSEHISPFASRDCYHWFKVPWRSLSPIASYLKRADAARPTPDSLLAGVKEHSSLFPPLFPAIKPFDEQDTSPMHEVRRRREG